MTAVIPAVLQDLAYDGGRPRSERRLFGLTLFERNLRLLRHAGIRRVLVVTPPGREAERILRTRTDCEEMHLDGVGVAGSGSLAADLSAMRGARERLDGAFLQLRADFVYDRRALDAVLHSRPNTFLVGSRSPFPSRRSEREDSLRPGSAHVEFLGLNHVEASLVDRLKPGGGFEQPADLGAILERSGVASEVHYLSQDEIPPYLMSLRRSIPVDCFSIESEADSRAGRALMLNLTQKGVLDFPAEYLHPVPENWIVGRMIDTPITPNQVTVFNILLAFTAVWLFWQGAFLAGALLALAVGVLDGVDGKLARLKLLYSRFGSRIDHVCDLAYEPLWYLAIGAALSASDHRLPLELSLWIVGFFSVDRLATGLFRRFARKELFDQGGLDRLVRRIGTRRNTNVLILSVGAVLDGMPGALWAILALTVLTACFHVVRALQLGAKARRENGWARAQR